MVVGARLLNVGTDHDTGAFAVASKVSNQEMEQVNVELNKFHDGWNYIIRPNSSM